MNLRKKIILVTFGTIALVLLFYAQILLASCGMSIFYSSNSTQHNGHSHSSHQTTNCNHHGFPYEYSCTGVGGSALNAGQCATELNPVKANSEYMSRFESSGAIQVVESVTSPRYPGAGTERSNLVLQTDPRNKIYLVKNSFIC